MSNPQSFDNPTTKTKHSAGFLESATDATRSIFNEVYLGCVIGGDATGFSADKKPVKPNAVKPNAEIWDKGELKGVVCVALDWGSQDDQIKKNARAAADKILLI